MAGHEDKAASPPGQGSDKWLAADFYSLFKQVGKDEGCGPVGGNAPGCPGG